jgi:hypothetical protein
LKALIAKQTIDNYIAASRWQNMHCNFLISRRAIVLYVGINPAKPMKPT